ncbi:MAG: hypothetical protein BroJett013_28960 [Alphaproteobacteria bacterium]|nr:MAG: hypothetical protein BroJett013_28960 [Alphaproteobacteria bacterium]
MLADASAVLETHVGRERIVVFINSKRSADLRERTLRAGGLLTHRAARADRGGCAQVVKL